jgi:hypothetical protein
LISTPSVNIIGMMLSILVMIPQYNAHVNALAGMAASRGGPLFLDGGGEDQPLIVLQCLQWPI